jgi:hypothetical protein
MIVSIPIDFPSLIPDDWKTFWSIWNDHSGPMLKLKQSWRGSATPVNDSAIWEGLDIYQTSVNNTTWKTPYFDIKERLPKLYNTIKSVPLPNLTRVRLMSSTVPMGSHSDMNSDVWEFRNLFYNPANDTQWYYTRPNDKNGKRTQLVLPDDCSWFAFNDKYVWHGTTFDVTKRKILAQVFYSGNIDYIIEANIKKFKNYTIEMCD